MKSEVAGMRPPHLVDDVLELREAQQPQGAQDPQDAGAAQQAKAVDARRSQDRHLRFR